MRVQTRSARALLGHYTRSDRRLRPLERSPARAIPCAPARGGTLVHQQASAGAPSGTPVRGPARASTSPLHYTIASQDQTRAVIHPRLTVRSRLLLAVRAQTVPVQWRWRRAGGLKASVGTQPS